MLKKILTVITLLAISVTSIGITPIQAANLSRQLKVVGTKVVYEDNPTEEIRLVGVNNPLLEWSAHGEGKIVQTCNIAMDTWKSNIIRLPINIDFWFGRTSKNQTPNKETYRALVDSVIDTCSQRGKYIILDLHEYVAPTQDCLDFWLSAAERYKNNPTVLFGLLNEPHRVSWDVWRNGGYYEGSQYIGHQQLIEKIRDTGAKNVLLAGGLDYAYNVAGILDNGGLLEDRGSNNNISKSGYGIIYDTHIYPMKGDSWEARVKPIRALAPVLVGEFGYDPNNSTTNPSNVSKSAEQWMTELLNWMDREDGGYGSQMHWTAWAFFTSPRLLVNNDTNQPSPFHGIYVYNKLRKIEEAQTVQSTKYTVDFNSNKLFQYANSMGLNDSISYEPVDNDLKISFDKKSEGETLALKADFPTGMSIVDLAKLKVIIKEQAITQNTKVRFGIVEPDGDIWAMDYTLRSDVTYDFTTNIRDFIKRYNQPGDGIFSGEAKSFYIEILDRTSGSFTIDRLELLTVAQGDYRTFEYPNPAPIPPVTGVQSTLVDFDTVEMENVYNYAGPEPLSTYENGKYKHTHTIPCIFKGEISQNEGIDNSKSIKLTYRRSAGAHWGGESTFSFLPSFDSIAFKGTTFISFYTRNMTPGITNKLSLSFLPATGKSLGSYSYVIQPTADWVYHKIYFADMGISAPELIRSIKYGIGEQKNEQGTSVFDNFYFGVDTVEFTPMESPKEMLLNTIILSQNQTELLRLSDAVPGDVDVVASIDNYDIALQEGIMVVAVYNKGNNQLVGCAISQKCSEITLDQVQNKELKVTVQVSDPQNQYIKVYFFKDPQSIEPLFGDYGHIPSKMH